MPEPSPVREWPQIELFRTLLKAHGAVSQASKEIVDDECGLSPMQFDMIAELGGEEPMPMGELGRRMITSPSSVTRVSKELEKKGLVQRRRAEASEREVLASLTPKGEAFFAKHFRTVVGRMAAFFDSELSAKEQRQLARLLARLSG